MLKIIKQNQNELADKNCVNVQVWYYADLANDEYSEVEIAEYELKKSNLINWRRNIAGIYVGQRIMPAYNFFTIIFTNFVAYENKLACIIIIYLHVKFTV